jgi:hypothetical protein
MSDNKHPTNIGVYIGGQHHLSDAQKSIRYVSSQHTNGLPGQKNAFVTRICGYRHRINNTLTARNHALSDSVGSIKSSGHSSRPRQGSDMIGSKNSGSIRVKRDARRDIIKWDRHQRFPISDRGSLYKARNQRAFKHPIYMTDTINIALN